MNQAERIVRILEYLEVNKTMNIQQMCEGFNISRDTARRDIVKLTTDKSVIRTYGGVSLASFHNKISDYKERSKNEIAMKVAIANKAVSLIEDNETIFLDVSTTVSFVAQSIQSEGVTVVTNSIDTAYIASTAEHIAVHLLGGILNKTARFLTGHTAIEKVKDYHFNKVFISAAGITEAGVSYLFEEDLHFKRRLIEHTDQVILLADASKYNQQHTFKALSFDSIAVFITNAEPPNELYKVMVEAGVEIIVTKPEDK